MSDCPVTLITGARKGIGRGLAEHYVRAGHQVIGCGRQGCDWEAKEFSYFRCDVTDESSVRGLFAKIRSNHGRLDHLINNAGIASLNHALLTPMTTVEKILSTNVSGVFLMCREAARLMQQRKYGRIVNLASVATPLKVAGEAVYAASKAAVVSLTEILGRELADLGITVNAVGPTPVATDMVRNVPEEKLNQLIQQQAIRRFTTNRDIANAIDFFLQKESDFITGQVMYLGGV